MGTEESSNLNPQESWQAEYDEAQLRDVPFETMSGVPVEPVYGDDLFPGQYPYTRGIYPSICLLYTSPSPRDLCTSRMPSSA